MNIPENIFNTLTEEQKKKAEAAKSPEELLAIAKEIGYEMSAEQLGAVAGGDKSWCSDDCPFCVHGTCKQECTEYFPCGDYCARYKK